MLTAMLLLISASIVTAENSSNVARTSYGKGTQITRQEVPAVFVTAQADIPHKQDIQISSTEARKNIAVVYPELDDPYRTIFARMLEGIDERTRTHLSHYVIGRYSDPEALNQQLKRAGIKVVITLGRQGLQATSSLNSDISIIAGAVFSIPENESRSIGGIMLAPDPALLFLRLKSLLPKVKRVMVVYDPQRNEKLIKIARDAAKSQGLELVAYEANDLVSAVRLYESLFRSIDAERDALWLPQDATTADETTILPLILKESWNRNIPVFSSSFLHVKKGVLFALYPDNVQLGRSLATEALEMVSGETEKPSLSLLRDVQTAVNLRTASHLGLNIGYQQQRTFDAVFPEP